MVLFQNQRGCCLWSEELFHRKNPWDVSYEKICRRLHCILYSANSYLFFPPGFPHQCRVFVQETGGLWENPRHPSWEDTRFADVCIRTDTGETLRHQGHWGQVCRCTTKVSESEVFFSFLMTILTFQSLFLNLPNQYTRRHVCALHFLSNPNAQPSTVTPATTCPPKLPPQHNGSIQGFSHNVIDWAWL